MNANPEEIVLEIRQAVDELIASARDGQEDLSLDKMERSLFASLFAVGRRLLLLFVTSRLESIQHIDEVKLKGKVLPFHNERKRSVRTVFGKIEFNRKYYYNKDGTSCFLLDALLNLPTKRTSDLLREWVQKLACCMAYHKSGGNLCDLVFQKLATHTIEEAIEEDSALVQPFYESKPPPPPSEEEQILVVQADGKGVPMLPESDQKEAKVRLSKGDLAGSAQVLATRAT